jgi:hypothetical protein
MIKKALLLAKNNIVFIDEKIFFDINFIFKNILYLATEKDVL